MHRLDYLSQLVTKKTLSILQHHLWFYYKMHLGKSTKAFPSLWLSFESLVTGVQSSVNKQVMKHECKSRPADIITRGTCQDKAMTGKRENKQVGGGESDWLTWKKGEAGQLQRWYKRYWQIKRETTVIRRKKKPCLRSSILITLVLDVNH